MQNNFAAAPETPGTPPGRLGNQTPGRRLIPRIIPRISGIGSKDPLLIVVYGVLGLFFAAFVVYPLFRVVTTSLTPHGAFSLEVYRYILEKTWLRRPLQNSVLLAVSTSTVATAVGFVMAYAVHQVNLPMKRFFQQLALLPLVSPPFMLTISIILLMGRNGLVSKRLLGLTDFSIYGFPGLLSVQTLSLFPIAYLVISGVLQSLNPELEEASLDLGASKARTFLSVTLPMCKTGIASAWLLVFVSSLSDFANPMVLAGKFDVLSVQAYLQFTGMFNTPRGSGIAILLLLPAMAAFVLQKHLSSRRSAVSVTGKPVAPRFPLSSRPLRAALLVFCSVLSAAILALYGTVVAGAFFKLWGVDYSLTLDHFKYAWDVGRKSVIDTVTLSALATPVTAVLGMVTAFVCVRGRMKGRGVLEFTSMLPLAVPGTVLGIGYVLAFNKPPLLLTGTSLVIVACFVFRNMPVGIEAGVASLKQIDPSIEEASRDLGADVSYTFTHITLPLIKPAFFTALAYSFVRAMTAVSAIIFLVSARWNHLTILILAETEIMRLGVASVLSVVLIAIVLTAFGLLRKLVGVTRGPAGLVG